MEREELKRRLIERLADSSTALVCNAYDFMGLHAPCANWDVKYLTPEFPPLVGEAITIQLDCSTPDGEIRYEWESGAAQQKRRNLYYEMVERIEQATLPQVVVIESVGDYASGAVIGDGMAKTFLAAGAVGCGTNGAVRDIQEVFANLGQFSCGGGFVVNHYSLRWRGLGEPVKIGGLEIRTGDLIHGDGDGIITLPEAGWTKVVRACRYVTDFEKQAHVLLRRTEIGAAEKERAIGALAAQYGAAIAAIQEDEI